MKSYLSRMLLAGVVLAAGAAYAEEKEKALPDMSPVVKEEFRRTKEELRNDLVAAKKKIAELDAERARTIAQAQREAVVLTGWVEHLHKYDILVGGRYSNERGEYQPAYELSDRDLGNINKIFEGYLHWVPIQSRMSADKTRAVLEEGQERLRARIKVLTDPTEKNNADLELIAKSKADAEMVVARTTKLATDLGFDLRGGAGETSTATAPTAPGTRVPAGKVSR